MSYKRTKYPDDSLVEDVYNKLNRLGRYASRQELLDEIRDLNLELEREKKILETYRGKYEDKMRQSSDLSQNLSSARQYQDSLLKEHKSLEERYNQLKSESARQKSNIDVLKRELDDKELAYITARRRALALAEPDYPKTGASATVTSSDERLLQELEWEKSYSPYYKYWSLRPWLYRNHRDLYDKYFPYTAYDPGFYRPYYRSYLYPYTSRYWKYDDSVSRRLALDGRMETIRSQIEDLKLSNAKMLNDARTLRNSIQ